MSGKLLIHTRAVVVLETMWGGGGQAPGLFRINPDNHSGRRLYKLLGHTDFLVTNACPQYVERATDHGRPDPEWLAHNLRRVTYDRLLVCGNVAHDTFDRCGYVPDCEVLKMPHPAARMWTKAKIAEWVERLQT